jgi:hypothetical protein
MHACQNPSHCHHSHCSTSLPFHQEHDRTQNSVEIEFSVKPKAAAAQQATASPFTHMLAHTCWGRLGVGPHSVLHACIVSFYMLRQLDIHWHHLVALGCAGSQPLSSTATTTAVTGRTRHCCHKSQGSTSMPCMPINGPSKRSTARPAAAGATAGSPAATGSQTLAAALSQGV